MCVYVDCKLYTIKADNNNTIRIKPAIALSTMEYECYNMDDELNSTFASDESRAHTH